MSALEYRKSVLAVFIKFDKNKDKDKDKDQKQVLVLERYDTPNAWQLPQGGVEKDESYIKALYREMLEELGSNDFEILKVSSELVSYDFPDEIKKLLKTAYIGQSAYWYLCKFNDQAAPYLDLATDKEFRAYKWVAVDKVLNYSVSWKKQAYKKGLNLLGLLSFD